MAIGIKVAPHSRSRSRLDRLLPCHYGISYRSAREREKERERELCIDGSLYSKGVRHYNFRPAISRRKRKKERTHRAPGPSPSPPLLDSKFSPAKSPCGVCVYSSPPLCDGVAELKWAFSVINACPLSLSVSVCLCLQSSIIPGLYFSPFG